MSEERSQTSSTFRREVNISQKRTVDVPIQKLDFSLLDTEFGSAKDKFDSEMMKMETEMNKLRTDFFGPQGSQMPSIMGAPAGSGDPFAGMPRLGGGMPDMPSIMPGMPPAPMMPPMPGMDGSGMQKTVTSKRTVTKMMTSSDGKEQRETSTESSHKQISGGDPAAGGALRESPSSEEAWKSFLTRNPSSPLIQEEGDGGKQLRLRFDVHDYQPEDIEVKTVDNTLCVRARHEERAEQSQALKEFSREILLPPDCDPEQLRSSLSKDGILTVKAPLAIEGAAGGSPAVQGTGPIITSPPAT